MKLFRDKTKIKKVERFKNTLLHSSFVITKLKIKFYYPMHILQPKHTKLKQEEVKKLLEKYNISLSQLPMIKLTDTGLPEGSIKGDLIKIERKDGEKIVTSYRVVI